MIAVRVAGTVPAGWIAGCVAAGLLVAAQARADDRLGVPALVIEHDPDAPGAATVEDPRPGASALATEPHGQAPDLGRAASAPALAESLPSPAHAQPAAPKYLKRARMRFERGVGLAKAAQWKEAAREFAGSAALAERPNTLFNLALAQIELEQPLTAYATLLRFLEITRSDSRHPDRRFARELLEAQRNRLGQLSVSLTPAHAALAVDGAAIDSKGPDRTLLLVPGKHRIRITASGHRAAAFTVALAPGAVAHRTLQLTPNPKPSQPASPAQQASSAQSSLSPAAAANAASRPATSARPVDERLDEHQDGQWLNSPWLWSAVAVVAVAAAIGVGVAAANRDPPRAEAPPGGTTGLSL